MENTIVYIKPFADSKMICLCCFKLIFLVNVILILQIAEGPFQRITQVRKHLAELELSIQSQSSYLGQMEDVNGVNDDMSSAPLISSHLPPLLIGSLHSVPDRQEIERD